MFRAPWLIFEGSVDLGRNLGRQFCGAGEVHGVIIAQPSFNVELANEIGKFYADPLGFVLFAYPWREPGQLADYDGPDEWQTEILVEVGKAVAERGFDGFHAVPALRVAIASGHGIGKSTLVAWLVDWIMSTRPYSIGTVTANTFTQLSTKTWAQIAKWTGLCITASWFRLTGEKMYHRDFPSAWFCSAQSSKEENSEAFAGQHAATSTSFYFFDEASAIPDKIFEVAEGGLTDGESMEFRFGNPTRNSGAFFDSCFGKSRPRWLHRSIDSRSSALTNKSQIAEWASDYGEDSDFFRVRVRGVPPRASDLQFIGSDRVQAAQTNAALSLGDDPLIAGVDVSGGGSAWNVCRFRRGFDARSRLPIRFPGDFGRENLIAKLSEVLSEREPLKRVAMMFIDSAFGSPIVERLHLLGYDNVIEVNFGAKSPDTHQLNMRAYMWNLCKEWLPRGSIDKNDERLEVDLTGPGWHLNKQNQLVLESKEAMQKRGVSSPDDGDALALTFAQVVAPVAPPPPASGVYPGAGGWMR